MAFPLSYPERNQGLDEEQNTGTLLDCSVPVVFVPQNEFKPYTLRLNSQSATEMLSALQVGAELTYPEKYQEIVDRLLEAIHCETSEGEGDCVNYLPYASFISFYPQNPYSEPNVTPDGYLFPPFLVNNAGQYVGYDATDVIVPLAAINIDPIDLFTGNLPQIQISVRGSGQIELDLLATQNGGYAILKLNSPPNILDIIAGIYDPDIRIIDLNSDLVAIPPETDIVIAEEFDIEASTPEEINVLYITFYPKTDDALIPLGFGGGLRRVGLCGLEIASSEMQLTDLRLTDCGIEVLQNGVWTEKISQAELDACFGGGGGGGGGASAMKISTYTVDNQADTNITSTGFSDFGFGIVHNFTFPNALIMAQLAASSASSQNLNIRALIDAVGASLLSEAQARIRGTNEREALVNAVFGSIPNGNQIVKLQAQMSGGTGKWANIQFSGSITIIEYGNSESTGFVENVRILDRQLQQQKNGIWLGVFESLDGHFTDLESQILTAQNTANTAATTANQAQITNNSQQTTINNHANRITSLENADAFQDGQIDALNVTVVNHSNRLNVLEQFQLDLESTVWKHELNFASSFPADWVVLRGAWNTGGVYADQYAPNNYPQVVIRPSYLASDYRWSVVKFVIKDDGVGADGAWRLIWKGFADSGFSPSYFGGQRVSSDTVHAYFKFPQNTSAPASQIGIFYPIAFGVLFRVESILLYGFGENPFS